MNHRIRIAALGLALLGAMSPQILQSAQSSTPQCVTLVEFRALDAGQTRSQVESAWDVAGRAAWDGSHSDPGHDAYYYPRCGRTTDDHRNAVRVIYTRHSRVWTYAAFKAHGTNLMVSTTF